MENGFSKSRLRPVTWLLRKLAHGLPPLPTIGGRALATRVAGLLLVGGAILIAVTVALPPAAQGSDLLILGYGAVAAVGGALMLSRRRVNEPALGLAAALGTALITLATLEGGHMTGTEDNEVLFLWVSLFAFWFFDLRHALLQLGLIGAADAILLIDQHPTFADAVTPLDRPDRDAARYRAADGLDPPIAGARAGGDRPPGGRRRANAYRARPA
jgi:hypothetical protein